MKKKNALESRLPTREQQSRAVAVAEQAVEPILREVTRLHADHERIEVHLRSGQWETVRVIPAKIGNLVDARVEQAKMLAKVVYDAEVARIGP